MRSIKNLKNNEVLFLNACIQLKADKKPVKGNMLNLLVKGDPCKKLTEEGFLEKVERGSSWIPVKDHLYRALSSLENKMKVEVFEEEERRFVREILELNPNILKDEGITKSNLPFLHINKISATLFKLKIKGKFDSFKKEVKNRGFILNWLRKADRYKLISFSKNEVSIIQKRTSQILSQIKEEDKIKYTVGLRFLKKVGTENIKKEGLELILNEAKDKGQKKLTDFGFIQAKQKFISFGQLSKDVEVIG